MTEQEIIKNLKRCPSFERCNKNLCPLDYELHLRSGGRDDKCRWLQKRNSKTVSIMPDNLLEFVPKNNISKLNTESRKRYLQITA